MRMQWTLLFIVLVASSPLARGALAEDAITAPEGGEPSLEVITNKFYYLAGEEGFVVLRLDTYGKMGTADIEVEILSPSGKLVDGGMMYTRIPKEVIVNPNTMQTAQILYDESIKYFGDEKTAFRIIEFEVPMDILSGDYTITGRAAGGGIVLHDEATVHMEGPGGFLNVIFVVYILILVYSVYLLRRE
ncbi:MAG: hypothetical protein JXC85_05540 [Candidatus Aenigmarchaeota archaeon]|nr:hypothetical protein [Candidatus Aenigmarchaeota archaeon]